MSMPLSIKSVDERADDLGAVQHLAALAADLDGETIEMVNLAVEEDDRHFGPGFVVNWRASRSRFRLWPRRSLALALVWPVSSPFRDDPDGGIIQVSCW